MGVPNVTSHQTTSCHVLVHMRHVENELATCPGRRCTVPCPVGVHGTHSLSDLCVQCSMGAKVTLGQQCPVQEIVSHTHRECVVWGSGARSTHSQVTA